MELTELKYFYNVAITRSFTKGAAMSHISPPAISKAIKKLEEELDVSLFDRTTRSVCVTDAGQVLLEHCREVFRQVESLHRDLTDMGDQLRGELRIGANEVFSAFLLPTAIARIIKSHPELTPRCFQMTPEQIAHGLREGTLDVGFTVGTHSLHGVSSQLIAQSEGVVVCGRTHPLYEKAVIEKDELPTYPFVTPGRWQEAFMTRLDLFPEESHPRAIGASADMMHLSIALVVEGAFLGYFPQVTIGCQLRHDELRVLGGLDVSTTFLLEAVTRKGVPPRASVQLLVDEVTRAVVETGGDPCGWTGEL